MRSPCCDLLGNGALHILAFVIRQQVEISQCITHEACWNSRMSLDVGSQFIRIHTLYDCPVDIGPLSFVRHLMRDALNKPCKPNFRGHDAAENLISKQSKKTNR